MDTKEFIAIINKLRISNKDKWVSWSGLVNGYEVSLKSFNTWIQVINVGMVKDSGPMDCSIAEFKEFLSKAVQ